MVKIEHTHARGHTHKRARDQVRRRTQALTSTSKTSTSFIHAHAHKRGARTLHAQWPARGHRGERNAPSYTIYRTVQRFYAPHSAALSCATRPATSPGVPPSASNTPP